MRKLWELNHSFGISATLRSSFKYCYIVAAGPAVHLDWKKEAHACQCRINKGVN